MKSFRLASLAKGYLDVRVVLARCPPLPGTAFLFPVLEELWIAENSHTATIIQQSKRCAAI